jgi:hypothetical protein
MKKRYLEQVVEHTYGLVFHVILLSKVLAWLMGRACVCHALPNLFGRVSTSHFRGSKTSEL